jgi:hypothetical protein
MFKLREIRRVEQLGGNATKERDQRVSEEIGLACQGKPCFRWYRGNGEDDEIQILD